MYAETIAHISDCSALNPRWGESGALTTAAKPMGSGVGSGLDQHMDGEVPADAERRSEELFNRLPGALDVLHDVGLPERAVRIVIRQVAFALQLRELLPNCRTCSGNKGGTFLQAFLASPWFSARYTRRHIGRLPALPARPSAQVRARQWNRA